MIVLMIVNPFLLLIWFELLNTKLLLFEISIDLVAKTTSFKIKLKIFCAIEKFSFHFDELNVKNWNFVEIGDFFQFC